MLVLSRKESEVLVITVGDVVIEVMVVAVRGDKVRVGIAAPPQVNVVRKELLP